MKKKKSEKKFFYGLHRYYDFAFHANIRYSGILAPSIRNLHLKAWQKDYLKVFARYIAIDKYMRNYSKKFSEEITGTTLKNIEDEYFLSRERAVIVSANEANTSENYGQYSQDIKERKTLANRRR